MLHRFSRDESGIAMGLSIIMIVLIGVMGAGLLVFVQTGLRSTVQVNQGQKALNMADAGVQAAKGQLIINASPIQYDGIDNPAASPPNPESNWSYAGSGRTLSLGNCNNCINVSIRYLLPATTSSRLTEPNYAPVLTPGGQPNYPPGVDYFRIISEGSVGETRRKVDAIYSTQTSGTPQGYFTQGSIRISGNITLEGLSMFAMGDITANGQPAVVGSDIAYDNWNRPPWNTTQRGSNAPGLGAVGTVPSSAALGVRDFGSNSTPTRFILKNPPDSSQTASQISFPFDYRQQPDLEDLRSAARGQNTFVRAQGNYFEIGSGTSTVDIRENTASGTDPKYPASSGVDTVFFVKFPTYSSSNVVNWNVSTAGGTRKGTLVVENGRLEMPPSRACLNGIAVIRGVPSNEEAFKNAGQGCLEGYANASGFVTIAGTVRPFTQERGNRPGFYGLRLWSWRECYNTACN